MRKPTKNQYPGSYKAKTLITITLLLLTTLSQAKNLTKRVYQTNNILINKKSHREPKFKNQTKNTPWSLSSPKKEPLQQIYTFKTMTLHYKFIFKRHNQGQVVKNFKITSKQKHANQAISIHLPDFNLQNTSETREVYSVSDIPIFANISHISTTDPIQELPDSPSTRKFIKRTTLTMSIVVETYPDFRILKVENLVIGEILDSQLSIDFMTSINMIGIIDFWIFCGFLYYKHAKIWDLFSTENFNGKNIGYWLIADSAMGLNLLSLATSSERCFGVATPAIIGAIFLGRGILPYFYSIAFKKIPRRLQFLPEFKDLPVMISIGAISIVTILLWDNLDYLAFSPLLVLLYAYFDLLRPSQEPPGLTFTLISFAENSIFFFCFCYFEKIIFFGFDDNSLLRYCPLYLVCGLLYSYVHWTVERNRILRSVVQLHVEYSIRPMPTLVPFHKCRGEVKVMDCLYPDRRKRRDLSGVYKDFIFFKRESVLSHRRARKEILGWKMRKSREFLFPRGEFELVQKIRQNGKPLDLQVFAYYEVNSRRLALFRKREKKRILSMKPVQNIGEYQMHSTLYGNFDSQRIIDINRNGSIDLSIIVLNQVVNIYTRSYRYKLEPGLKPRKDKEHITLLRNKEDSEWTFGASKVSCYLSSMASKFRAFHLNDSKEEQIIVFEKKNFKLIKKAYQKNSKNTKLNEGYKQIKILSDPIKAIKRYLTRNELGAEEYDDIKIKHLFFISDECLALVFRFCIAIVEWEAEKVVKIFEIEEFRQKPDFDCYRFFYQFEERRLWYVACDRRKFLMGVVDFEWEEEDGWEKEARKASVGMFFQGGSGEDSGSGGRSGRSGADVKGSTVSLVRRSGEGDGLRQRFLENEFEG